MMSIVRRIRGALGNALLWGAAWSGVGIAYLSTIYLAGGMPEDRPWRLILYVSANLGAAGFVAGAAFSAYLAKAYRNHDLLKIGARRFALGGALTAGALASLTTAAVRLVAGVGINLDALLSAGVWGVVLGGVTAAGTIKLAQYSARRLNGSSRDQLGAGVDALGFRQPLSTETPAKVRL